MHTLHYFYDAADGKTFVQRTTVLRDAFQAAGTTVGMAVASFIVREAQNVGVAVVLSDVSEEAALAAWNVMINGGLAAKVDATEEDLRSLNPDSFTAEDADEGEAISTWSYRTAIALLATAKGSPLVAASYARVLAGTTDDEELYTEVIQAYALIFPWLPAMLRAEGIIQ